MPAANLQTICSSGALLQPCVALFTCPQPFVHAHSKCQSWVCVPVLAVLPGLGVCVCASPGFRPWTGCVCVCASPGCVRQSWLFFQDWVCVCVPVLAVLPGLGVCARWFFQDWVCVCVPVLASIHWVCVPVRPFAALAPGCPFGPFLPPWRLAAVQLVLSCLPGASQAVPFCSRTLPFLLVRSHLCMPADHLQLWRPFHARSFLFPFHGCAAI